MTKKEVEQSFKEMWKEFGAYTFESDGIPDYPARREAWNNFTDSLCKEGQITLRQYESWLHPRFNG